MAHVGRALLAFLVLAAATAEAGHWERTKNIMDDVIYDGRATTFYCGCQFRSDEDSDGSGDITSTDTCGYEGPDAHDHRANRVEWEHIVPASLMPARELECWDGEGGSRDRCEDEDPRAQAMIFDLYNLAPSIGQVNALRSNDRYGDLPDDASDFGDCPIEDAGNHFEPTDCLKGDVARVWLYMRYAHGVEISAREEAMFVRWASMDPVSPWESEREERIARYSRVNNPYVDGVPPDVAGACPWE